MWESFTSRIIESENKFDSIDFGQAKQKKSFELLDPAKKSTKI